eukprot:3941944-Rhodomonas_salina.2
MGSGYYRSSHLRRGSHMVRPTFIAVLVPEYLRSRTVSCATSLAILIPRHPFAHTACHHHLFATRTVRYSINKVASANYDALDVALLYVQGTSLRASYALPGTDVAQYYPFSTDVAEHHTCSTDRAYRATQSRP